MIIKVWFNEDTESCSPHYVSIDGLERDDLFHGIREADFLGFDLVCQKDLGDCKYTYELIKHDFFINFKHVLYFEIIEE